MAVLARDKPVFYNELNSGVGTRVNADGTGTLGSNTNGTDIYTGGTYGSIVESLVFSTDDTTAVNAYLYIYTGTTVKPLGIVNIPIQSGDLAGVANVDALAGSGVSLIGLPVNAQGKRYIPLKAGDVLKYSTKAEVTSTKSVHATALAFDATTT
jgi:hypothetical protein